MSISEREPSSPGGIVKQTSFLIKDEFGDEGRFTVLADGRMCIASPNTSGEMGVGVLIDVEDVQEILAEYLKLINESDVS